MNVSCDYPTPLDDDNNEYENAIEISDVWKTYGVRARNKSKSYVLKGVNLNVKRSSIYGLLGPSGCGKTTLLKCLVGRLSVDAGSIQAFGKEPGVKGSGIPGPVVGYMPQELALFMEFSVAETLAYFGRLFGLRSAAIREKTDFLVQFLELPEKSRTIAELSGGQQRRVSFATALLHEPALLILDEPTVGVDPLLRESIWGHLTKLAKGINGTTIVVTTHYIEEAKQADAVGLMRAGRLLAQDSPSALMARFGEVTLEPVFLKLCAKAEREERGGEAIVLHTGGGAVTSNTVDVDHGSVNDCAGLVDNAEMLRESAEFETSILRHQKKISCCEKVRKSLVFPTFRRFFALTVKDLLKMRRNWGFLLFEFLLPAMQVVLFCLCVGGPPIGLDIGLLDKDLGPEGKRFTQYLDKKTFSLTNYTSYDSAFKDVRSTDSWGFIYLKENFTTCLISRFSNLTAVDNATLDCSSVHLVLDMTNQQISLSVQEKVMEAFKNFAHAQLGSQANVLSLPIILDPPVYGSLNPSFTDFMAPGVIITIIYFMATGLTALTFVMERKEGLLDRSFVAGVTILEVLLAHMFTQFIVMLVQIALLLIFALVVFHVPSVGPIPVVIILTMFLGFTGMALGFFISSLCKDENSAIQMAIGSIYPSLLLSGIIWPVEAMPSWLKTIAFYLPLTYPVQAMRSILGRGFDLSSFVVWRGFLVAIGWGWGLLAVSMIILRLRS